MRGCLNQIVRFLSVGLLALTWLSPVFADQPVDWQMGFQDSATSIMDRVVALHDLLLWVQFVICGFVALLLFYIVYRFKASRNPKATKVTHNTTLEVVWTAIPVLILLVIAFPSLRLLYYMDVTPKADMTLKAIGNQWYWSYEYPDYDIEFDSYIVEKKDLQPGQLRLLSVDKRVIVPIQTNIRLITTSNDVLHSWAIPAFGIKKDSIPGRLNEAWFNVQKEGIYYGQCSELCGPKHGFMPIVVEAVSKARFEQWVQKEKPPSQEFDVAPPIENTEKPKEPTTSEASQKTPDSSKEKDQLIEEKEIKGKKPPQTERPSDAHKEQVKDTQDD